MNAPAIVKSASPAVIAPKGMILSISGMTCASCSTRLERALLKVHGVDSATVNLLTETAEIESTTGCVRTSDLLAAVRDTGFSATIHTSETGSDKSVATSVARRRVWETRRLIAMTVLAIPLLIPMLGVPLSPWLQLILATAIQFGLGGHFYVAAWKALRTGAGNMDLLVVLGTSAAYGLSLYLLVSTTLHPAGLHQHMISSVHLYFETSAVVMTFITLGKRLETRARQSTTTAIRSLMDLRPETALVARDGGDIEIPASALAVDDIVIVKPGGRLPADGVIVDGSSHIDEGLITGESTARARHVGDAVIGASINGAGLLRVRITSVGAHSTLERIIALVDRAQTKKATVQRLADRVSAIFIPVVLVIAAATFFGWWLTEGMASAGFMPAISVLVVACPCALGLATPTALMVGTGVAARSGILIRDVEALERSSRIDVVALDKTGTLTQGRPAVTDIVAAHGSSLDLVQLAASAEQGSEHPIAKAVLAAAAGASLVEPGDFEARPGLGLTATVGGRALAIGNRQLMRQEAVATSALEEAATTLEEKGKTVLWIAALGSERTALGIIAVADPLKPTARDAVMRLKLAGMDPILLTGDNQHTADTIARAVGITTVKASLLPADKLREIERLQIEGKRVAMVGDGINDAPALVAADVGIAIGTGADVALNSAGITLLNGDPRLIGDAISISRATYRRIIHGLCWAFGYNVIAMPLAAFGLLSPTVAGGLMALSSVGVVCNALLLKRWHPQRPRINSHAASVILPHDTP